MSTLERTVANAIAGQMIDDELCRLGLISELRSLDSEGWAQKCQLRRNGAIKTTGLGKGPPAMAALGARYEALEHYVMQTRFNAIHVIDLKDRSRDQVRESGKRVLNLHDWTWTKRNAGLPSNWTVYTDFLDGTEVSVPTGAVDAEYTTSRQSHADRLIRQHRPVVSNSGVAIGACESDAILHALNELCERFCFSQFLLHGFLLQRPLRIKALNTKALPEHLASIIEKCRATCGVEVRVIDISARPQRVMLAQTRGYRGPREAIGLGCSMCAELATSRAVWELFQNLMIAEQPNEGRILRRQESRALSCFRDWPAFRRVTSFDLSHTPENITLDSNTLATGRASVPIVDLHVDDQVRLIATAWAQRGVRIYKKVLHRSTNGICCVSLVAPALGQFYLSYKTGWAVMPTPWQTKYFLPSMTGGEITTHLREKAAVTSPFARSRAFPQGVPMGFVGWATDAGPRSRLGTGFSVKEKSRLKTLGILPRATKGSGTSPTRKEKVKR